jgi:hypothetical protein
LLNGWPPIEWHAEAGLQRRSLDSMLVEKLARRTVDLEPEAGQQEFGCHHPVERRRQGHGGVDTADGGARKVRTPQGGDWMTLCVYAQQALQV